MKVGDRVNKSNGYFFPGIIVAEFRTIAGLRRFVVECTVPAVYGCLHIFSENQLDLRDE